MSYDIITIVAIFVLFIAYNRYQSFIETKSLIKELTISLKSKDVVEYKDNAIEDKEIKIVTEPKDEFINIEDVDPNTLLNALKK